MHGKLVKPFPGQDQKGKALVQVLAFTLGQSDRFKYQCLQMNNQCVHRPATEASSSWMSTVETARLQGSPAEPG